MAADDFFIPGLVRIAIRATSEGSNRLMILHWKTTAPGPLSVTDLQNVGLTFWTLIGAPIMKPLVGAGVNFEDITVTDRSAVGMNQATYVPPQPQAGTASGELLPANTAVVMKYRTGRTGRRHHGRSYMFGQTEAQANGSLASSNYVTALASLAATLISHGGTVQIPLELVVASRKFLVMTKVISAVVDAFIDSQRNRLINRGY